MMQRSTLASSRALEGRTFSFPTFFFFADHITRALMGSKGCVGSAEAPLVNGFTVLRVRMAQLPFVRVLYIKRHHSKKQEDGGVVSAFFCQLRMRMLAW